MMATNTTTPTTTPTAIPVLFGPDEAAAVGVGRVLLVSEFAGTVFTTVCPGAVTTDATVLEADGFEPEDGGSAALSI